MLKDPFPTDGISFYKGKRVTVTGASGLIGSYAVKLLKESGATVRAALHRRPSNAFTMMADSKSREDLLVPDGAKWVAEDSDVVIACAGITGGVNLPKIDPVSYVGPATAIFINTLHACWEKRVPLVGYLSSTTVYPPSPSPSMELDSERPDKELYPLYRGIGVSKRFLEKLCRYYHETTGIGVGIVRPAGAYGRFDNFDERTSHVLPGMVARAMGKGSVFEVWGDGNDVRDFIHAQDVARALLLATAKAPDARPFNAASGRGVTTRELAETVLEAVGRSKAEVLTVPEKPTALKSRTVDVALAREVLGFEAEISLADGVRDVVAWRRAQ